MSPRKANQRDNAQNNVDGIVGSLALSMVRPGSSTLALRALYWYRQVWSFGVRVPFFLVHDLGLILAVDDSTLAFEPRVDPSRHASLGQDFSNMVLRYRQFVEELRHCQVAERAAALRLSDAVIAVVLSKLLQRIGEANSQVPAYGADMPGDAALFEVSDGRLFQMYQQMPREFERTALQQVERYGIYVLTLAETMDVDTLRLLGVLGTEAGTGAGAHVDMMAVLESPSAHDVVNFSLEILPRVLETKTRSKGISRRGLGVGGVGRKGELDRLLLSELAWDADDFARRVLEGEALYYSKEAEPETETNHYLLLIDASASMRGQREVFARGMALATGKKLLLQGADVTFQFFDARLYPPHGASQQHLPTAHVLSFRGERGRNPTRVFGELLDAFSLSRDDRARIVYVFTHAAFYLPRTLVEKVGKLASLAAVFMLPSGGSLQLDYLDLLDRYWVVDGAVLRNRGQRVQAAHQILDGVGVRGTTEQSDGVGSDD